MEGIKVFDNVFTQDNCVDICKEFRRYDCEHKNVHGQFNINSTELNNPIEYMIQNIIREMGDTSNIAEYWYRESWLHMTCHQDVNEYLFKSKSEIKIPNYGNILYISDGIFEGGTFIFDKDMKHTTLIFPKRGRYVRFNGNLFHYVPAPFSFIFDNELKVNENKKRIVLLFNTWNEFIPDPSVPPPVNNTDFRIITNERSQWQEQEVFQTIPLNNKSFSFRTLFMGGKLRRLGTDKLQRFYINNRIRRDGYHRRVMRYEIEKIDNDDEFEEEPY